MEPTSLQQRNIDNYKKEIAFLQKEAESKGIGYALRFSWIMAVGLYISDFLFSALIEHQSLMQYLAENSWKKILFSWIFWFVIDYFWLVKGYIRQLKIKENEYEKYKQKIRLDTVVE